METSQTVTVLDSLVTAAWGYGLTILVALAAAGLIWAIVVALEAFQKRQEKTAEPAAVSIAVEPEPEAVDETARHVAAIAAAVYATIGAVRLVHIGEAAPSPTWKAAGRTIHQTSHLPRRSPNKG